jgi:hypothetical protein
MWVLVQGVSMMISKEVENVQYLGDDGEVGEVGEYFGEAGVISAGAGTTGQQEFALATQSVTC